MEQHLAPLRIPTIENTRSQLSVGKRILAHCERACAIAQSLENGTVVPQNTENQKNYHVIGDKEIACGRDTCLSSFIAAPFALDEVLNQPK